jgi:tellurite methyltransferase
MVSREQDKRDRIHAARLHDSGDAARVLTENRHLLPAQGQALDIACGAGANAILLARHGLDTTAWDVSAEAIGSLTRKCAGLGLQMRIEQRDVIAAPPEPRSFDVITASRFLDRPLMPRIIEALRPQGLVFYQTFIRDAATPDGPRNPAYRLEPNELLSLFSGLQILVYREEGTVGDTAAGWRNEAMLVARKH